MKTLKDYRNLMFELFYVQRDISETLHYNESKEDIRLHRMRIKEKMIEEEINCIENDYKLFLK